MWLVVKQESTNAETKSYSKLVFMTAISQFVNERQLQNRSLSLSPRSCVKSGRDMRQRKTGSLRTTCDVFGSFGLDVFRDVKLNQTVIADYHYFNAWL